MGDQHVERTLQLAAGLFLQELLGLELVCLQEVLVSILEAFFGLAEIPAARLLERLRYLRAPVAGRRDDRKCDVFCLCYIISSL